MKSILKRKNLKNRPFLPLSIILVFLIVFLLFTSCQDEVIEITGPDQQEVIIPNSNLANLISEITTTDATIEDIGCYEVVFPIWASPGGLFEPIETQEAFDNIIDDYGIEGALIQYPITILDLNNYSIHVEINNAEELETLTADCLNTDNEDNTNCISFLYPLTLSLYNTNFEIIETVTIENDVMLNDFIDNLDGSILASLNFPVTLILGDGSTVIVNNNEALETAIQEAEEICNEEVNNTTGCTEEDVSVFLMDCQQLLTLNGYTPGITNFTFFDNGNVFSLFEGDQFANGTWQVDTNEMGPIVVINFTPTPFPFITDITKVWQVIECNDEILQLQEGDNILIIEKLCNNDCYPEGIEIIECGENGIATFDLEAAFEDCTSVFPTEGYYETLADAENQTNPIIVNNYTNLSNPQTIYAAVFTPPAGASIHEITLVVEDCTSTCNELVVDDYLQTCIWNVVNYNNSDDLITFDFDFNDNGTVIITGDGQTITAMWSTTETTDGVWVEFLDVNGANIQAITGNWLIVECNEDRLEMTKDTDTMVLEQTCS